jgi:hypothetical protein
VYLNSFLIDVMYAIESLNFESVVEHILQCIGKFYTCLYFVSRSFNKIVYYMQIYREMRNAVPFRDLLLRQIVRRK